VDSDGFVLMRKKIKKPGFLETAATVGRENKAPLLTHIDESLRKRSKMVLP
jgi:hypothetical protein